MGNVNKSVSAKPASIEFCSQLVAAYIKHMNETIFGGDEYIIPISIVELCSKYYYPSTIMIWLNHIPAASTSSVIELIHITDINNMDKHWTCAIHNLPSNSNAHNNTSSWWNMYCNAVCFSKNVTHCLPTHITDDIVNYYNNTTDSCKTLLQWNPYHIIFKSGGLVDNQHATDNCNAIIFNDIELQKQSTNKINCFNWRLPSLPLQVYGNKFVYSDVYGLLSIGGIVDGLYLSSFYNLSFDSVSVIDNDWKWNCALPTMHFNRYLPSSTMITYNKLIVVGGYNGDQNFLGFVEMFDFNENEWKLLSNIRYERNQCGIYHDDKTNKVYIGGGRCDLFCIRKEIEYLDLSTNKWLHDIPKTNHKHNIYPQIWKDEHNPHILCIASVYNNCMEYIDLRLHNKSWNVLYGNTRDIALSTKFGIDPNIGFSEYCKLLI